MGFPGESVQLDYALNLPKVSRVFRYLLAGFIGIAVLLSHNLLIDSWRSLSVRYHQQQCLNHPIPANSVVYSSNTPIVSVAPAQVTALLEEYANHQGWMLSRYTTAIFAGELKASNGLRRFVAVEANINWIPGKGVDVGFLSTAAKYGQATAVGPGPSGGLSTRDTSVANSGEQAPSPGDPEVVIRSAVIDPKDPCRISFTIRAFHFTFRSIGRLKPDGTFIIDTQ